MQDSTFDGPTPAFWKLPTGSRIAHLDFPAATQPKRGTIVFLHGGPGAYSLRLELTTRVISQLREDGYDVHFYDQVGSGLSPRLADPTEYTVERHVADLEAIRQLLGSPRLILIGSSWGATLAAQYLARHSKAVQAVIFSGPGVIYPGDWTKRSYGRPDEALSEDDRKALAQALNYPPLLRATELLATDPLAAHRLFPDDVADRIMDSVIERYLTKVLTCPDQPVTVKSEGYGFWSNKMTSQSLDAIADPRPALRDNQTPTLVLHGECEYMKREVALQYAQALPRATFVEIPRAGHMIYWDQPQVFLEHVREFLAQLDDPSH